MSLKWLIIFKKRGFWGKITQDLANQGTHHHEATLYVTVRRGSCVTSFRFLPRGSYRIELLWYRRADARHERRASGSPFTTAKVHQSSDMKTLSYALCDGNTARLSRHVTFRSVAVRHDIFSSRELIPHCSSGRDT